MAIWPIIPPGWEWAYVLVCGQDWPQADEDKLREVAQAWTDALSALVVLASHGNVAASKVTYSVQSISSDQFETFWKQYVHQDDKSKQDPSYVGQLALQCEGIAAYLLKQAEQVEFTKLSIDIQIAVLIIQLIWDFAIAPFTMGASLGEGMIAAFVTRMTVQKFLLFLLRSVLIAIAPDFITQAIMTAWTHHRSELDGGEIAQAGQMGFVAGLAGLGLGTLSGRLTGLLARPLGAAAGSLITAGLHGMGTNLITNPVVSFLDEKEQELFNPGAPQPDGYAQQKSGEHTLDAAINGIFTGMLFHGARMLHERPISTFQVAGVDGPLHGLSLGDGKYTLFTAKGSLYGTGTVDSGQITIEPKSGTELGARPLLGWSITHYGVTNPQDLSGLSSAESTAPLTRLGGNGDEANTDDPSTHPLTPQTRTGTPEVQPEINPEENPPGHPNQAPSPEHPPGPEQPPQPPPPATQQDAPPVVPSGQAPASLESPTLSAPEQPALSAPEQPALSAPEQPAPMHPERPIVQPGQSAPVPVLVNEVHSGQQVAAGEVEPVLPPVLPPGANEPVFERTEWTRPRPFDPNPGKEPAVAESPILRALRQEPALAAETLLADRILRWINGGLGQQSEGGVERVWASLAVDVPGFEEVFRQLYPDHYAEIEARLSASAPEHSGHFVAWAASGNRDVRQLMPSAFGPDGTIHDGWADLGLLPHNHLANAHEAEVAVDAARFNDLRLRLSADERRLNGFTQAQEDGLRAALADLPQLITELRDAGRAGRLAVEEKLGALETRYGLRTVLPELRLSIEDMMRRGRLAEDALVNRVRVLVDAGFISQQVANRLLRTDGRGWLVAIPERIAAAVRAGAPTDLLARLMEGDPTRISPLERPLTDLLRLAPNDPRLAEILFGRSTTSDGAIRDDVVAILRKLSGRAFAGVDLNDPTVARFIDDLAAQLRRHAPPRWPLAADPPDWLRPGGSQSPWSDEEKAALWRSFLRYLELDRKVGVVEPARAAEIDMAEALRPWQDPAGRAALDAGLLDDELNRLGRAIAEDGQPLSADELQRLGLAGDDLGQVRDDFNRRQQYRAAARAARQALRDNPGDDPEAAAFMPHPGTRGYDAETKLLAQVLQVLRNLGARPSGVIAISPDKPMCPACQDILARIQSEFPDVTFTVGGQGTEPFHSLASAGEQPPRPQADYLAATDLIDQRTPQSSIVDALNGGHQDDGSSASVHSGGSADPGHPPAPVRAEVVSSESDANHVVYLVHGDDGPPLRVDAHRTRSGWVFVPEGRDSAEMVRGAHAMTPEAGVLRLVGHSNEYGLEVGRRTVPFTQLVGALPIPEGTTLIELYACRAGAGRAAAQLAVHLRIDVVAGDDIVWLGPDGGALVAGVSENDPYPKIPPDGQWHRFSHVDGHDTTLVDGGPTTPRPPRLSRPGGEWRPDGYTPQHPYGDLTPLAQRWRRIALPSPHSNAVSLELSGAEEPVANVARTAAAIRNALDSKVLPEDAKPHPTDPVVELHPANGAAVTVRIEAAPVEQLVSGAPTPGDPLAQVPGPDYAPISRTTRLSDHSWTVSISANASALHAREATVAALAEINANIGQDRTGQRLAGASTLLAGARDGYDGTYTLSAKDEGRLAALRLVARELAQAEGQPIVAARLRLEALRLIMEYGLVESEPPEPPHAIQSNLTHVGAMASAFRLFAAYQAHPDYAKVLDPLLHGVLNEEQTAALLDVLQEQRHAQSQSLRFGALDQIMLRRAMDELLTERVNAELAVGDGPVFDRLIVGGGWAAVTDFVTARGAQPFYGLELPSTMLIANAEEPWFARGELEMGQNPAELEIAGLAIQAQHLVDEPTHFARSLDFAIAVEASAALAGVPTYHSQATLIEPRPVGDLSWPPDAQYRVTVQDPATGEKRVLFAAAVDIASGPGPARQGSPGHPLADQNGHLLSTRIVDTVSGYELETASRTPATMEFYDSAGVKVAGSGVPADVRARLGFDSTGGWRRPPEPRIQFGGTNMAASYTADERVLVYGAGASAAWDVEQAAAGHTTVEWVARPTDPVKLRGATFDDPNLQSLHDEWTELDQLPSPTPDQVADREALRVKLTFLGGYNRRNTLPGVGAYSAEVLGRTNHLAAEIEDVLPTMDGKVLVRFKDPNVPDRAYDRLVLSIGQDSNLPGGVADLIKGAFNHTLVPILGAGGEVDGLQDPTGTLRVFGAAAVSDAVLKLLANQGPVVAQLDAQAARLPADSLRVGPSVRNHAARISNANRR